MLPTWNLGTKKSWNLVILESYYRLGILVRVRFGMHSGLRSGRTDVRCTFEINTENLIRLNMIGHNVGT